MRKKGEMVCFYCRKPWHKISDCVALKKKEKSIKHVGLISTLNVNSSTVQFNKQVKRMEITEMEIVKNSNDFVPFLTEGVFLCLTQKWFLFASSEILRQGNQFCWKDFCLCLSILPLELMCWSEGLKWVTWKFLYTASTLILNLCRLECVLCFLSMVYIFWPRIKCDVSKYVRSSYTCLMTGKPNKKKFHWLLYILSLWLLLLLNIWLFIALDLYHDQKLGMHIYSLWCVSLHVILQLILWDQ